MLARKGFVASLWLTVVLASAILCACAKPPQPMTEEPPAAKKEEPGPPPQPTEMPEMPPPKLDQVQEAVKRIFKDAVVIDESHKPAFLVGDFNGDKSQDLAIVLRPAAGKLSELNQEFPVWIAREPLAAVLAKTRPLARPVASQSANTATGQTVRFQQTDVLLAIIHGVGPKGWHDPEATQTHLLRDVVGADMRTLTFKDAVTAYRGVKPFPVIYSDLIQETLVGQSGFLHFDGGIYAWYDPKNFTPAPMLGHSPMSKPTSKMR